MANYWEGPSRSITPSSYNYGSNPFTTASVNPYLSSYAVPAAPSAACGYQIAPHYGQSSYPSAQYPSQLLWDVSQTASAATFPGAVPFAPPQTLFQPATPNQFPGTTLGGIGGQSYQLQTPTPPPENYRPSSAIQTPFQQPAPWSYSAYPSQQSIVQTYQTPLATPQMYLSPTTLLDNPYPFWLNLAYNVCSPCRFTEGYGVMPLSASELAQPATDPLVARLSVVFDEPFNRHPGVIDIPAAFAPVVTVRDVAETIHWRMQRPIRHDDWNKLAPQDQNIITEVYRMRTRGRVGEAELGVKWVDMLKGKWGVRGLRNDQGTMKVVVS